MTIQYSSAVDVFQEARVSVTAPQQPAYLGRLVRGIPMEPTVLGDGDAVAAAAPLRVGGGQSDGWIVAARPLSGVAPELAIVRRRVIIAMIVVLGLAALAGIALARVLGGRIRRLASTAATLAGGDLSARASDVGVAPEELQVLRRSINGMAERLESLVGAITSERDRDRAMIGSLAEGVLTVAPDGTVTVANDAASRYLGLPGDAGPARLDALPAPIIDAVLAARADEASEARPRQVTLPDGVELELAVSRLGEGPHAGTVITLRDVTAQRRLERARRDLVANVSHELKTPIAALKGFLELLEGDGVSERHRREFLAAMSQETSRLERLVEEQLQLARLDAGALRLDREEVDLGQLATEVVAPRVPLAAREGVELSARPQPRRAGRGRRRPRADRADPPDPPRQRPAPHAARRDRRGRCGPRRRRGLGRGARHRRGHPARLAGVRLRPLLPRRRLARGPQRRPGARHRARPRRRAPGQHRAGVGGREGSTFTLRLPLRPARPPAPGPPAPDLSRAAPGNVRPVTEGQPTALVTGAGAASAAPARWRSGGRAGARSPASGTSRPRRTPTPAPASM